MELSGILPGNRGKVESFRRIPPLLRNGLGLILLRQTFTPSEAGVRAPDQREISDGGHESHRETATSGVSENIVGSRLVFVGGRRKGEVVTATFRIGSGITGAEIGRRVRKVPRDSTSQGDFRTEAQDPPPGGKSSAANATCVER